MHVNKIDNLLKSSLFSIDTLLCLHRRFFCCSLHTTSHSVKRERVNESCANDVENKACVEDFDDDAIEGNERLLDN